MPLVHSEKIDANTTLLLWNLTEDESVLREMLGQVNNMDELASISHPQKIREWLASRLLIKKLVEEFGILYEGLHKDEHGKAFLVNNGSHISLTHTADYVAAVLNLESSVGIDMEKRSEKLIRTARKFLSEAEFEHSGNDITRLCIYWCAKEALYKLYGKKKISFKHDILIHPFESDQLVISGTLTDDEKIVSSPIQLFWIEDHCLAISL
ncbi:4-phosphopantetheinyl transferase [Dyadobacter luteus]|jgi:4'-phosphopantetheinyl transferase|uniref:4-phosphopantetheinyl transferase n=1 Tax=Dyadobacter luteus TaxID=2259619 RepID=A0A3D8YB91_9BACT|nr:4'-phosphopantetheinyl transferase superfamily protein [Dyadobacter luteus]REA61253.1 4-phosphopantetheinyl transferase [Dyadobacter luteus]